MPFHAITDGALSVEINSQGAELSSLKTATGQELLWQGGPVWPRRAPILFPIVGRMPGDELIHDGVAHPIRQHGFARDSAFAVEQVSASEVVFTLTDSAGTLAAFPFPFRLEVRFSVAGSRLDIRHTVTNTGDEGFSASLGGHPGFAWPLAPGVSREAHTIEFAQDEPAPIRRIADGLVLPDPVATPVEGSTLRLHDELFVDDAIIFDALTSRSLVYSAPGAPAISIDFPDFPLLGVWSRAPGHYVCIEPWFGMTAPVGFTGEYDTKPGQFRLEPGESRQFAYSIGIVTPE